MKIASNSIEVSVVMCCYNSEQYISETLESLLCQSFQNFELIIINDGSTDNTMEIINNFTPLFSVITVVDQPNLGLNESRNKGLTLCSQDSKFVIFLDSDDLFSEDLLESLVNEISNNPSLVAVFSKYIKFDDSKNYSPPGFGGFYDIHSYQPIKSSRQSYLYFDLITGIVPAIEPTFLFSKHALIEVGAWDEINFPKGKTYGELIPLLLQLKNKGNIIMSRGGCYFYRQHLNQITKNVKYNDRRTREILNKLYFKKFPFVTRILLKLFLASMKNAIRYFGSYKHVLRYQLLKFPILLIRYLMNQLIIFLLLIFMGNSIKKNLFI